ncbi:hypothetical protein N9937_00070 [bacterium]|nr:hypothetical protein [bacterium]
MMQLHPFVSLVSDLGPEQDVKVLINNELEKIRVRNIAVQYGYEKEHDDFDHWAAEYEYPFWVWFEQSYDRRVISYCHYDFGKNEDKAPVVSISQLESVSGEVEKTICPTCGAKK